MVRMVSGQAVLHLRAEQIPEDDRREDDGGTVHLATTLLASSRWAS